MSEKRWLDERRQISTALELRGIAGEDIAPLAFVLAAIKQLQAKLDAAKNTLRWIKAELRTDNSEGNKLNRIAQALKEVEP